MYLSELKLWNFRKYGSEETIDLSKPNLDLRFTKGVNVLIGENDSGKTAIIDAIKLVLKTHSYEWIRPSYDDFHFNSLRFRIELKFLFGEDEDNEAKNFTEWLGWKDNAPFLRLTYDVSRDKDGNIIPTDVRAGVDDEGTHLDPGAKEYLKVTYLRPLRDAQSELAPKKGSRLSQILRGHEAFKGRESDHILVDEFGKFNSSIRHYFTGVDHDENPLADQKGKGLKDEIDKYIQAFYEHDKFSEFGVSNGTLTTILERLDLAIQDGKNLGLGTLNRLFMASELLHLNKKDWSGLRLGLIEELEAHLHPQAQMRVIEALQKQDNVQLIITTHSPNIGSKIALKNLILCHDKHAYPMGVSHTKLSEDDYQFLEIFLDTTKANLFYAKGVIMVEGWAEEILIPALARKLKRQGVISSDLTEAGVSIVNVGSTAYLRYAKIFMRTCEPYVNMPVSVVADIDVREYKKDGTKTTSDLSSVRTKYTTKAMSHIEQNVKLFLAPRWTLEYSLYQSTSLSVIFQSVAKSVHSGTDWATDFERKLAEKLINRSLDKVEIAYRLAQELDNDNKLEVSAIRIDEADTALNYLVKAIKYACQS